MNPYIAGAGVAAVAGCSHTFVESEENVNGASYYWYDAASTWGASQFVAGSSYTLCAITINLKRTGAWAGTHNLTAYIYNDSTNNPGTSLGTSTNTLVAADLSTSQAWTGYFEFSGVSIISTTKYWIVITTAIGDGSNYFDWYYGGTGLSRKSSDGITWNANNTNILWFRTYR